MRVETNKFLINGMNMLAPDGNLQVCREDVVSADSGPDESGVIHRFVVRRDVGRWDFSYDNLTLSEYCYMEQLFSGKDTFRFSFPSVSDDTVPITVTAYRAKHTVTWHNLAQRHFCNYKFSIIEC